MESEVNVRGAGLMKLFRVYIESDVPQKDSEQSEKNNAWEKVWARLDKKGIDLMSGETQNKKAKGKSSFKGNVKTTKNVLPEKKEEISNNFKSKSRDSKEK